MTIFRISSFPSVNLLYIWKLSTQPDYRHSEGSRPGQPLKTGPKSDYLLIPGHSLPLSCSWLLPHLHTVWQYLNLFNHKAHGTRHTPAIIWHLQLWWLWPVLHNPEGTEPELNKLRCIRPPKSQSQSNIFVKHKFVPNYHTILIKQIGTIGKLLNPSWQIFRPEYLYFDGFFLFFNVQKPGF